MTEQPFAQLSTAIFNIPLVVYQLIALSYSISLISIILLDSNFNKAIISIALESYWIVLNFNGSVYGLSFVK